MYKDGKFHTKLGLPSGSSFPTTPTPAEGDMFYREDEDALYIHDGTSFVRLPTLDVAMCYENVVVCCDNEIVWYV